MCLFYVHAYIFYHLIFTHGVVGSFFVQICALVMYVNKLTYLLRLYFYASTYRTF